jgi:vacuolar-type H+-ATPase subunit H
MLRLSELLERLRPAGTPGAPTEGEQQRRHQLQEREIAAVTVVLRAFEQRADQMIAAGRAEAERRRRDGERRADLVRAQLPDRIAIARAEAVQQHDEQGESEIAEVEHGAQREIARIEADAETRVPQLADAVVATIWWTLTTAPGDAGPLRKQDGEP